MKILLLEKNRVFGESLVAWLIFHQHTVSWFYHPPQKFSLEETEIEILLMSQAAFEYYKSKNLFLEKSGSSKNLILFVLMEEDRTQLHIDLLNRGVDYCISKTAVTQDLLLYFKRIEFSRRHSHCPPTFFFEGWTFVPEDRKVSQGEKSIWLSPCETWLLKKLLEAKGAVVSFEWLKKIIKTDTRNNNSLSVHVHKIHQKLGKKLIFSVYGEGYYLNVGVI